MPEQLLSCTELPPKVNSFGVWKYEKGPLKFPLPLLQMQILAILAVIHTLHFVLKHLGLPMLISEIAVSPLPLESLHKLHCNLNIYVPFCMFLSNHDSQY